MSKRGGELGLNGANNTPSVLFVAETVNRLAAVFQQGGIILILCFWGNVIRVQHSPRMA